MAFELPPLPYAREALEPHISAKTLEFHHGKHHNAYVTTLNGLIKGTDLESKPLEEIIKVSYSDESKRKVFNNSGQVWNHTFFWNSMKPNGGGAPSGDVADAISRDFGGLDKFKEKFKETGVGQFGSGWVWLVVADGKLQVVSTANAVLPMVQGQHALLTCDVWEHAYYLDYQNRRPDFLQTFLDHLVNWEFVGEQLKAASAAVR